MALPRSLTGPGIGPFIGANGAVYYVWWSGGSPNGEINVYKSANPDTTAFAVQDAADNPTESSTPAIRGTTQVADVHVYPSGDKLYIVASSWTTPAMGDYDLYVDLFRFDMSDDQWETTGGGVGAVYNTTRSSNPSGGGNQVRIMVRGQDGDISIIGPGPDAGFMGTDYRTVVYSFWNGSTWSSATRIDTATGGIDYYAQGLSDDFTTDGDYLATWWDFTAGDLEGRMLTGASHTQQTAQEISASHGWLASERVLVFNDAGTWRGSLVETTAAGTQASEWTFDPTQDVPTFTEDSDITGADTPLGGLLLVRDAAEDTLYCLYIVAGTPDEMYMISSVDQGAWGDRTLLDPSDNLLEFIIAGGAFPGAVYTSPSTSSKVIGIIYRAGGSTWYYDEIDIAGAAPPFPPLYSHRPLVFIPYPP